MRYLFILLFVLTSCGTRKVIKNKSEEKIESVTSSEIVTSEISRTIVETDKIVEVGKSDEKEVLIPINSEKPIVKVVEVDNNKTTTTWHNASVDRGSSKSNSKSVDLSVTNSDVDKTNSVVSTAKTNSEKKDASKQVDTDNSWVSSWFNLLWLLIPIGLWLLHLRYNLLKSNPY